MVELYPCFKFGFLCSNYHPHHQNKGKQNLKKDEIELQHYEKIDTTSLSRLCRHLVCEPPQEVCTALYHDGKGKSNVFTGLLLCYVRSCAAILPKQIHSQPLITMVTVKLPQKTLISMICMGNSLFVVVDSIRNTTNHVSSNSH